MKKLLRFATFVLLGTCMLAVGRVEAQLSQNGPYYANPSWDQQLPASTRFVVLTNWGSAAVLDRETGLVWERAPDTADGFPWTEALFECRSHQTGGRLGWRLPTQEETFTLLDPTQTTAPVLPAGHPFQGLTAVDVFWTASTEESGTSFAYALQMSAALILAQPKTTHISVWCVRGGSGAQNPF